MLEASKEERIRTLLSATPDVECLYLCFLGDTFKDHEEWLGSYSLGERSEWDIDTESLNQMMPLKQIRKMYQGICCRFLNPGLRTLSAVQIDEMRYGNSPVGGLASLRLGRNGLLRELDLVSDPLEKENRECILLPRAGILAQYTPAFHSGAEDLLPWGCR